MLLNLPWYEIHVMTPSGRNVNQKPMMKKVIRRRRDINSLFEELSSVNKKAVRNF